MARLPEPGLREPSEVRGLQDIREALDHIDRTVIGLWGLRLHYVKKAADFKPDRESIPAPERVVSMLADRRAWAQTEGLDPAFIGPFYAQLIQWFIDRQTEVWLGTRGEGQGLDRARETGTSHD